MELLQVIVAAMELFFTASDPAHWEAPVGNACVLTVSVSPKSYAMFGIGRIPNGSHRPSHNGVVAAPADVMPL